MKTNKKFHTYTYIRYAFLAKLFLSRCLDIGLFLNLFLFIYFHFFLAIPKSRLIKTHAPKKRTRPISNLDPCAYAVWGEELWGRDCANIQSSWPKKLDLSHGQKQNFILCRVLLWTMTCNYWKVFSEWHGFKAWLGFVPFSKLGLVKYQTLARRRPRWRTISSDCTWPALVKMETETVSLKTKRIPVYDTFAGNEVNQVGV